MGRTYKDQRKFDKKRREKEGPTKEPFKRGGRNKQFEVNEEDTFDQWDEYEEYE